MCISGNKIISTFSSEKLDLIFTREHDKQVFARSLAKRSQLNGRKHFLFYFGWEAELWSIYGSENKHFLINAIRNNNLILIMVSFRLEVIVCGRISIFRL